ncbi:MAG: glycerophosphoryl diester phosphodiesterase [Nitrospira sp. CG24B]|nr:MAG: glycerophosphoryl diester phosphodiesterase [Nitrospira sp. CG24B]
MTKESPTSTILRIGHRGACGHAPENTLASIEQAIVLRCALTEVDIRRTSDDELVLLHDERVDRTTNGRGRVADLTLPDIRTLDAGGGESPPTLDDVLKAASGRIGLILELKTGGSAYDVCAIVRGSGFTQPVIYASFLQEELQHVRRANPQAQTMILFTRLPANPGIVAARLHATHVGLRLDTVTEPLVNALHNQGLIVFAYTANQPAQVSKMKRLGVDGIISDFPDLV